MATTLQRKLVLPLAIASLGIAIIGTLLSAFWYQQRLSDYLLHRAKTMALAVQFAAETFDKESEIQRMVSSLGGEENVRLIVVVFGEPERVIAATRQEWLGLLLTELPAATVAEDLTEALVTRTGHAHAHRDSAEMDFTVPISRPQQHTVHLGSGAAMVHLDARAMMKDVWLTALQQGVLSAIIVLSIALLAWWLIRRHVLQPSHQIERVLQAQAHGQREQFARLSSDDELGRVAHALDHLLQQRNDAERAVNIAREQAEHSFEEVRVAQQRLQIATKAGKFGVWEWWVASNAVHWDDRMYELFGRDKNRIVTNASVLNDFLSESERLRIGTEFDTVVRNNGTQFSQQFVITRGDGQRRIIQDEANLIRDEQGQVARVVGISWDITDELAHQAEQKKLALVARHANNLIVIYNRDFEIEWANSAFEQTTGYCAAEYLGRKPPELLYGPETDAQIADRIRSAIELRAVLHSEVKYYTKSRQTFWVETELVPVMVNDRLDCFISIDTVVTERIQAQFEQYRLLHEMNQQRQALDEHAIVAITDAAGRITYANDKFCIISKFRREELLGQYHRIVNSGQHSREFWQAFWATISSGNVWQGEICNKSKDGSLYWVETTVVPFLNENGKPYQYIALRTDMTARVLMEKALQHATERAEVSNRSKSEFLANMSHEIRTPMNAVLGLSVLLRDTPLNEQQKDYVNTIYTAGDALLTIINDILDFSKIEAGKMELSPIAFDLDRTLYEVLRMLSIRAQEKNLELILDYDNTVPRRVVADPVRIRQVLSNLIGNAVKFTPTGHVCARVRALHSNESSVLLRIDVEDTGIGMDETTQQSLFESFKQANASISRQFGGTGLGLAISKRIVELMHGKLQLTSAPGQGSTFTIEIELPLAEPTVWQEQVAQLRGETIWLMEGHALARLVLARQLKGLGIHLREFATVDELQRALPSLHKETLLIDGEIAANSGVLSWWKVQQPEAALVILAAQSVRGEAAAYRDIPACAYLSKPTDLETLQHSLRMVLAARDKHESGLITKHVVAEATEQMMEPKYDARVLVAEDVVANQMVIRAMLKRCGIDAVFANNGEEAVWRATQTRFDLIFMDCQMPVMDGLSATQQLRQTQTEHIPIIALTANALQDDRQRCLDAGMDDFLAKPVRRKLLHEILLKWLPASSRVVSDTPANK